VEQCDLWGDLGTVLISGFARRQSLESPVSLERTGPFLPPISFPWLPVGGKPFIVSDQFKRTVEAKGLPGVRFRPAVKSHIVKLMWHEWDRQAWPPTLQRGEPENYVRGKRHDARTASQMPEAWELLPLVVPLRTERIEDPEEGFLDKFRAYGERGQFPPFFVDRPDNYADLVVDDASRAWLQDEVGDWLKFCEVQLVDG
jgi:hypothetical protein